MSNKNCFEALILPPKVRYLRNEQHWRQQPNQQRDWEPQERRYGGSTGPTCAEGVSEFMYDDEEEEEARYNIMVIGAVVLFEWSQYRHCCAPKKRDEKFKPSHDDKSL